MPARSARRMPGYAVAVTLLAVAAGACSGAEEASPAPPGLTAVPVEPSPAPAPSTNPAPGPTVTPTPSPSATPTPREPTAIDQARFVAGYLPEGARDLEHVAVDLDGDDREELLFAYVSPADSRGHLDVAWWQGTRYEVQYRADGGPAERVDRLRVADVNGDGAVEVAMTQSVGSSGSSISLWQAGSPDSQALQALPARGGCADGLNTYGVVGTRMEDRDRDGAEEIYASCDDSPLPVAAWSTDAYVWRDGAYRYELTLRPDG